MDLHKELPFENEICEHLAAHGWLYAEGDAARYDRARALFPEDLVAWVRATQPKAWATLEKHHGGQAAETLLGRVRSQLDQRGTLEVLRKGVDLLGLSHTLKLAEYKPSFGKNPEILARYRQNRLRVVRQVRYSVHSENSFDLVLFLNGIAVATAELKSDFTQSVGDAIDQYRFHRLPKPKGKSAEPLLGFPSGALVHFAVSGSEVRMTTRLAGPATVFLPFNQGDHGAAGNPVNPRGHRTAYLWEHIWEPESWLEIIGRYLIAVRDKKQAISGVIFPRYHQLDVTRRLQAAALADGPGGRYLIQHSAGSGKTNSIAWTAHFFAELHDARDKKLFDTVVVVSDRNVIDDQLSRVISGFERKQGVVALITNKEGSKSAKLAEALSGTKKIVVSTIQTFPFALDEVRRLSATEGKRFAVIADEAHSSQAGAAAAKLKELLSPQELDELEDGGEVGAEDLLAAQMSARADDSSTTFVAFTATPKNKTMELFGTRPDPSRKPGPDNVPTPFHVYTMRQAIEEGFILDVLQNYTPYSLAFRLAHQGAELDEREVDKTAALKKLMGWVRLHPHNIAQKVELVIEHFRSTVAPLLDGKAKAMVVVSTRVEAVRWQLAMQKYIARKGYALGTLVAFSGKVLDPDTGDDEYSERSAALNPGLETSDIAEAFKGDEYQVLLAANKFQMGFDQPLLCGMYVDKRLANIQAVQTLSRLNRAYPGKDTTYVVDFMNQSDEVLAAFRTYYETAELITTTDPHLVLDLRAKLDAAGHYDDFEVDRVVYAAMNPQSKQSDLCAAIEPVADRLLKHYKATQAVWREAEACGDAARAKDAKDEREAMVLFKSDMGTYIRLYSFLSQIFDYTSTDLEKRAIFYRVLVPLLDFGRERESVDLSKVQLTHHALRKLERASMSLGAGEATKIPAVTEAGGGKVHDRERALLEAIISQINELFGDDVTDQDGLGYLKDTLMGKLLESEMLKQQAENNTEEQFAASPDLPKELTDAVIDAFDAHAVMSAQILNNEAVREKVMDLLLNNLGLYQALRARGANAPAGSGSELLEAAETTPGSYGVMGRERRR